MNSISLTIHRLNKAFNEIDTKWMKRKRKLNTATIFSTMHQAFVRDRGIAHILEETFDVSAMALSKARSKIPVGVFADVNRVLVRTMSPRILAVDGSKVHVNPSFVKEGFSPRTNNCPVSRPAVHPLAMLTAVVDVDTKCCVAHSATRHFNERRGITDILPQLNKDDILVFDRGYFSRELLGSILNKGMHAVFRLKITAFRGCKQFFQRNKVESRIPLLGCGMVRLVKYRIDGNWYACLTTLPQNRYSTEAVKAIYGQRWRVEEFFKRLKSTLKLETSHSKTSQGFLQEVDMRILTDTITLLTQERMKIILPKQKIPLSYIRTCETTVGIILEKLVRIVKHYQIVKKAIKCKFKNKMGFNIATIME